MLAASVCLSFPFSWDKNVKWVKISYLLKKKKIKLFFFKGIFTDFSVVCINKTGILMATGCVAYQGFLFPWVSAEVSVNEWQWHHRLELQFLIIRGLYESAVEYSWYKCRILGTAGIKCGGSGSKLLRYHMLPIWFHLGKLSVFIYVFKSQAANDFRKHATKEYLGSDISVYTEYQSWVNEVLPKWIGEVRPVASPHMNHGLKCGVPVAGQVLEKLFSHTSSKY